MRPQIIRAPFAALVLCSLLSGAVRAQASITLLQEPAPMPAPRLIGPETGEPEKDSYGIEGGGQPECQPAWSRVAGPVGLVSGDPEKDSYGFTAAPGACRAPG